MHTQFVFFWKCDKVQQFILAAAALLQLNNHRIIILFFCGRAKSQKKDHKREKILSLNVPQM